MIVVVAAWSYSYDDTIIQRHSGIFSSLYFINQLRILFVVFHFQKATCISFSFNKNSCPAWRCGPSPILSGCRSACCAVCFVHAPHSSNDSTCAAIYYYKVIHFLFNVGVTSISKDPFPPIVTALYSFYFPVLYLYLTLNYILYREVITLGSLRILQT